MTIHCDVSTYSDVKYVVDRAWDRGVKEAEFCGFKDRQSWIDHIQNMSQEYGFVLKDDELIIAVLGATCIGDTHYTYFAATSDFERAGREATAFLVDFLQQKMVELPISRLELASACDHPKAHKWFLRLGFELIRKQGICSLYVYQGVKQKVDFKANSTHNDLRL